MEKIEQIVGDMNDLKRLVAGFEEYKNTIETVVTEMGKTVEFLGEKVKELDTKEISTAKIDNDIMDIRAKIEAQEGELRQLIEKELGVKIDNLGNGMEALTSSINILKERQDTLSKKNEEVEAQVKEALAFKRSLQIFVKSLLGGK